MQDLETLHNQPGFRTLRADLKKHAGAELGIRSEVFQSQASCILLHESSFKGGQKSLQCYVTPFQELFKQLLANLWTNNVQCSWRNADQQADHEDCTITLLPEEKPNHLGLILYATRSPKGEPVKKKQKR